LHSASDCSTCIDPTLLSLTGNTVVLPSATRTALPTGLESFNFDSSHPPFDAGVSRDLHGLESFADIEVSASSTTQNPHFSNEFYDQTSFDNRLYFPGACNDFMFDSNIRLDRTPLSFDSFSFSLPTPEDANPTISTPASQSSAHTPTPTPSPPPSPLLRSPSSPSSPIITTTSGRITCTWPTCTKSFPSVNTYKYFTLLLSISLSLPILPFSTKPYQPPFSHPFPALYLPFLHPTTRDKTTSLSTHERSF